MARLPRTEEEVRKTIAALEATKFAADPLVDPTASRTASIVSSAYKRHGFILERALLEKLEQSPRFQVWEDRAFSVPQGADHVVAGSIGNPTSLIGAEFPYGGPGRTIQVDLLVFDKQLKKLSAYEVKRGTGLHDSGKRRSILRDLLCTQLLLRSYGATKHIRARTAESKILFYYGKRSIEPPFSLVREELDDHFEFEVVADIEEINCLYRDELAALLRRDGGRESPTAIEGQVTYSLDDADADEPTSAGEEDIFATTSRLPMPAIKQRSGWLGWLSGRR
jgi:hypothetical protein